MRRSGEVVSKATILDHVWDFAFEGDPNIVEVYVAPAPAADRQPFGRDSLQTVRLVGYRLDPDGRLTCARSRCAPGRRCWRRVTVLALLLAVGRAARAHPRPAR